jgi:BMFP domain-containing protein YqiC
MGETRKEKKAACFQFHVELGAYLEGENRPFVTSHAAECPFCNVVLADLAQLRSVAVQSPLEDPSPAVWANIRAVLREEGIIREEARGWGWFRGLEFLRHPAPVGALACLVILGSFLTIPPKTFERGGAAGLGSSLGNAPAEPDMNVVQENALTQTIQDLERNFRASEASLGPEMKAIFENSLNSLDLSIRECKDSLQQEPDNALAHDYLLTAYSRKAELLASALEFEGQ